MTSLQQYLQHLDNIFQTEPKFYREYSQDNNQPGVSSIVYHGIPEAGMTTAITYGLSEAEHPDWKFGRPELCLTVASLDPAWGQIAGYVANQLRGSCPFKYGSTINFREKIADDSDMDAFFIFTPAILERDGFQNIHIGQEYKINIAGLYPIYSSEIQKIDEIGLKDFFNHPGFDLYNVQRQRIA